MTAISPLCCGASVLMVAPENPRSRVLSLDGRLLTTGGLVTRWA
jgi:hypothetical protein